MAVAILLTALMLPVANALRKGRWGLPRAATAVTVIGAVASIVAVLIVIGGQIAGQGAELSTNVVNGFNQLSDWLNNGPLTEWLRNGPLHWNAAWLDSSTWVARITDFLRASGSTTAGYAAEFGQARSGTSLLVSPLALFALFYFIYDGRGIFTFLLKFIPRASRIGWISRRAWLALAVVLRAGDNSGRAVRQHRCAHCGADPGCPSCSCTGGAGLPRRLRTDRGASRVSLPCSSHWSRLAGSRH